MSPPEPAAYPNSHYPENESVLLFINSINRKRIKTDIKTLDKYPNIDGSIEIINDKQQPIAKLDVQIRTIGDSPSYQCEMDLVGYSNTTTLPLLLIAVDHTNKKVYWKHIWNGMPEMIGKEDQKSFVIKFDPASGEIIDESELYLRRWLEIAADYQSRISNLPAMKEGIAQELGLEGLNQADIRLFQEYIDTINKLLDSDFVSLKRAYFSDVWKLGVAVFRCDDQWLEFQLFAIPAASNAPLVVNLTKSPTQELWQSGASTLITRASAILPGTDFVRGLQSHHCRRSFFKPEKQGRDFVIKYLEKALRDRIFPLHGPLLLRESLFAFLDQYRGVLQLSAQDDYSTDELNKSIRLELPARYQIIVRKVFGIEARAIPLKALPALERIAGIISSQPDLVGEDELREFLAADDQAYSSQLLVAFPALRPVLEALDYFASIGDTTVHRVYRQETVLPLWTTDAADQKHNLETILLNARAQYKLFLAGNRLPGVASPQYLNEDRAIIYFADLSNWRDPNAFHTITEAIAFNDAGELPRVQFFDRNLPMEREQKAKNVGVLDTGSKKVELESYSSGWANYLFDPRPMLNVVYDMFTNDLQESYGLSLPQRFVNG